MTLTSLWDEYTIACVVMNETDKGDSHEHARDQAIRGGL